MKRLRRILKGIWYITWHLLIVAAAVCAVLVYLVASYKPKEPEKSEARETR
jgi:hypothetical protein